MSRATLYCGDALAVLLTLPAESVQCVVTSPPYWGLRDYGMPGQLGLEATPQDYVARMVEVFQMVRRVLRNDGTLWLNLGDSYAGSWGAQSRPNGNDVKSNLQGGSPLPARQIAAHPKETQTGSLKNTPGCKAKDLVGIPWRVAFALQADGWWLREDIIWQKPNPMPESVTDRCTRAHEYLFHFSKAERYYHDADAIAEPLSPTSRDRLSQDVEAQVGSTRANGGAKTNGPMKAVGGTRKRSGNLKRDVPTGRDGRGIPNNHLGRGVPWEDVTGKRNARSVWTIGTQSYAGAHFATFPEELARRCIVAGSRPGDTVLDPFGGSGTVAQVAIGNGRNSIYIDLNPAYLELAKQRIGPLLCEVA